MNDLPRLGTEQALHPCFENRRGPMGCRCSAPKHSIYGCTFCYNVTLQAAADTGNIIDKIKFWLYKI